MVVCQGEFASCFCKLHRRMRVFIPESLGLCAWGIGIAIAGQLCVSVKPGLKVMPLKEISAKMNNSLPYPRVRILLSDSGRGLQIDADLLEKALSEMGCAVERKVMRPWSIRRTVNSYRYARVKSLLPHSVSNLLDRAQVYWQGLGKSRVDLQIHLESLAVDYLSSAPTNWLIPNQEWVRTQHLSFFNRLDRVLCKTEEAAQIMRQHHKDVRMLGFSNPVLEDMPRVSDDLARFDGFLHVAGRNRKKGTVPIVEAWRRNPGWPVLNLVVDDTSAFAPVPGNVRVWKRPDEQTLARLRRENGIVLAPSEVEGYGHTLIEGMASQQVVVTTDAAPMNELLRSSRGYLLPWERSEPCHLGRRYFVEADAIEQVVIAILGTPQVDLLIKSAKARSWCIQNHTCFLRALEREIEELRSAKAAGYTSAKATAAGA